MSEWKRLKTTAVLLCGCCFYEQDVNVHCAECHLILNKSSTLKEPVASCGISVAPSCGFWVQKPGWGLYQLLRHFKLPDCPTHGAIGTEVILLHMKWMFFPWIPKRHQYGCKVLDGTAAWMGSHTDQWLGKHRCSPASATAFVTFLECDNRHDSLKR